MLSVTHRVNIFLRNIIIAIIPEDLTALQKPIVEIELYYTQKKLKKK